MPRQSRPARRSQVESIAGAAAGPAAAVTDEPVAAGHGRWLPVRRPSPLILTAVKTAAASATSDGRMSPMCVRALCAVNAAHHQRWNEPAEATGRADQLGDRARCRPRRPTAWSVRGASR